MRSGFDFVARGGELLLFLRLILAALVGAAIGWNRYRAGKPAGVGTHALVAVGAALFVAIPAQQGAAHGDALSRAIQGIATGIGFIGAGEIFRDPGQASLVHGLTSAAALWVTAAIGIIAMCGSWVVVALATVIVLAVLEIAPRVERRRT